MLRKNAHKVPVEQLYVSTDPESIGFNRTDQSGAPDLFHGQKRAADAFQLAAESTHLGFNGFVGLPPGYPIGGGLARALKPYAETRPAPPDLVCVNNFEAIEKPLILEVPAGTGASFETDVMTALDQVMEGVRAGQFETVQQVAAFFGQLLGDARTEALAKYAASAMEDLSSGLLSRIDLSEFEDEGAARQIHQILRFRYAINVLVDNGGLSGAPLIAEETKSMDDLFGGIDDDMIERVGRLGPCHAVTAGAYHRAQGGYIVSDLSRLPRGSLVLYAQVLSEKKLWFPNMPECNPICESPTKVRAFWHSDDITFAMLSRIFYAFEGGFKVSAQFEDEIERTDDTTVHVARILAEIAKEELDAPLDAVSVARLVEHCARMAQDGRKLLLDFEDLRDIMREANTYTKQRQGEVTRVSDVEKALTQRVERSNAYREFEYESILEDRRLVETSGSRVGQINGLTIFNYAQKNFSVPKRITARVRLGEGDVVQIHREVGLSSVSHEKGSLTMEGYLMAQYGRDLPFALNATVNFEQNFSFTSGDSSSAAQLFALVSAISGVPIKQSIGVTGTMDQVGHVQAIGGVNLKIEGFFDICQKRGLDGSHGVLIPQANVRDLMLREDIVDAVRQGKFAVYAVETIDQGLEVLMGMRAGARNRRGQFPRGSINAKVEERIRHYAEKRKFFGLRRWI